MRKAKKGVKRGKKTKKHVIKRVEKGHFAPGESANPAGKPKGTLSLKTRVCNDILSSYFEKKVKGSELIRNLPQGSRGIKQYLDYIVTLIKGGDNKLTIEGGDKPIEVVHYDDNHKPKR